MFGRDNSIEPLPAVRAVAVTANGHTATRDSVEPLVREATAGELASAARRTRSTSNPEQSPVQAVPEARGGFFRRRPAEPDKPDAIAQPHGLYTAEEGGTRRYFADFQQKQEVMRAGSKRITTRLDDKQTVSAMLDLAQSRGWDTVRLRGTADFQREAWVQAQVRGMNAEGYKPTSTDQQEAARRKTAMASVQASPVKAAPPAKAIESTPAASVVTLKDVANAKNSVTVSAVRTEKADTLSTKAAGARQPKQTAASNRPVAAASAQTASSTDPAKDGTAVSDRAKLKAQRSKSVWGAVEATGRQARAADAVTAKATAMSDLRR